MPNYIKKQMIYAICGGLNIPLIKLLITKCFEKFGVLFLSKKTAFGKLTLVVFNTKIGKNKDASGMMVSLEELSANKSADFNKLST